MGTSIWTNTAGGNWSIPANWSPRLPLLSDEAEITTNGRYVVVLDINAAIAGLTLGATAGTQTLNVLNGRMLTLNGTSTVNGNGVFMLTGGTLTGSGDLTTNSTFFWDGGVQSGSGKTTVTGTLQMNGGTLITRTLETQGNTVWSRGNLSINNATWNNTATGSIDLQSDTTLSNGGSGIFNNLGTLTKSVGSTSGASAINLPFNNTGTVNVLQGTLRLGETGGSTGKFNIQDGAVLLFDSNDLGISYTLNDGTTFTGAGIVRLRNKILSINGNIAFPKLDLTSYGTLTGSGNAIVSNLIWNGGVQSGSGKTTVTGTLQVNGGTLIGRTLETQGNTIWSGLGSLNAPNAIWNNTATGVIDLQSDAGFGGDYAVFNNFGTLTKSVGTTSGASAISALFNNTGTVNVSQGTLYFRGGYTQTAGTTQLAGGTLRSDTPINIQRGTLSGFGIIRGNVVNAGQTNPEIGAGTLNITGNYTQTATGTLNLELGGATVGSDFTQVNISGTANLGGTLNISLINGFTPQIGNQFQVLNYGSISGSFSNLTGLTLSNGLALVPTSTGNNLILETVDGIQELGVLAIDTTQTRNGFVGDADKVNIYRFNVTTPTTVEVNLTGLTANVNLRLTDSLGRTKLVSNNSGTSNEFLLGAVEAGIYFLRVDQLQAGNNTNYLLQIATAQDAGNTLATARDLGAIGLLRRVQDFVGSGDSDDYYRFHLNADGIVNLRLSRVTADATLQLLDAAGNVLVITSASSGGSASINRNLFSGTYYARVIGGIGTAYYTLETSATEIPDQAGSSFGSARDLGVLSGSQQVSDFVGNIDPADFYRFQLNTTSDFSLSLDNTVANVSLQLFNSHGNQLSSSNTAIAISLEPGVYYVKVQYLGSNTNYNLNFNVTSTAPPAPFQIRSISPDFGGTGGQTTIALEGNQFTPRATVALVAPDGTEHLASQITWYDSNNLTATFNLENISTSDYHVRVTDTAGVANSTNVFHVQPALNSVHPILSFTSADNLEVTISAPEAVRPWDVVPITVNYRNVGTSDIVGQSINIRADKGTLKDQVSGMVVSPIPPANLPPCAADSWQGGISFMAGGMGMASSVLSPGGQSSYTVLLQPDPSSQSYVITLEASVVAGMVRSSASTTIPSTPATINWNCYKDYYRPASISSEAWDIIWQNFTNSVGNTVVQYQNVMAENATRLSQLGNNTSDEAALVAFELQQAGDFGAIAQRNTLGLFGWGHSFTWNITATTDSDGDVTVNSGGNFRFFTHQPDGSFVGSAGDTATLARVDDVYQLREQDGTLTVFRPNGKFDYIQDTNGNRVQAIYTSNQLTGLNSTNGDNLTFAYNSQGRISQVTNRTGQITTYSYDSSGEYLLGITTPQGTTSYTYITTPGASQHAISSITYSDGSHQLFEYDSQGRLSRETSNGGTEALTYSYDSAGGVTITDSTGARTRLLLNDNGQVGQIQDPLNRVTQLRYDTNGNLTRVIAPNNTISSFTYDTQGNLLSSTDPLGHRVDFTYELTFNQLQRVTDARGNSTSYSYDNRGNLNQLTYADGSKELFSHDDQGNLSIAVNRRNQSINYTYDAQGQLIRKDYGDGTAATFTYDARGNLLSATDADSSVTYTYDNANRLTQVTENSGRFLEFSYDSGGRRSRMVDQAGNITNYAYDALGRLSQLTDGNNNLIAAYTYDARGYLSRGDNGNGTYTTYSYDAAGQLLNLVNYKADNSVNSRFDYAYDSLGRRTSMTTLEGTTNYGYDATGQLTSVSLPNGRQIQYQYDAAGNRIAVTDNGVTTAYNSNNLNEYTTVGNATYSYDADGNLISKTEGGQTSTYTYDAENRLIGVTTPQGTWSYEYDALGNRIASVHNGQRTEYLLNPTGLVDVVGEYDNTGNLIANYIHGLGLESQISGNGTKAYYDFDAIGSTTGLTGAAGSYLNRYSYLPFGENLTTTESVANPFEYVGQWGVMGENSGLYFMRARYYDSKDGRFTSEDPIGLNGQDLNFYRYVSNTPANNTDPLGLAEFCTVIPRLTRGNRIEAVVSCKDSSGRPIPFSQVDECLQEHEKVHIKQFRARDIPQDVGHCITQEIQAYDVQRECLKKKGVSSVDIAVLIAAGFVYSVNNCQKSFEQRQRTRLAGLSFDIKEAIASILVSLSRDPNDVVGPAGFGQPGWLTSNQTLPYQIQFENAPDASAPAVFVTVTQQLDSDLDWNTFQLGDFGFGNIYIDIPDGFQTYSQRLDLRNTIGDFVDFNAGLDRSTGIVTWSLRTIDPYTGQIPVNDANAGFLPPDNDQHVGEGFVSYSIKPKSTLPTGTTLAAQASIVFDTNAPINTPTHLNTIDNSEPSSIVTALPATSSDPNFMVSWTGNDSGSGIASYDIFVSIDGTSYIPWLKNTTDTSAAFGGQPGHTYAFYSIAHDNVGHIEIAPTTPDTQITIAQPIQPGVLAFSESEFRINENGTPILAVTINRTNGSDGAVSATLTLTNGTATAPDDFSSSPITVNFGNGETSKIVTIPIVNDALIESDETINLTLTNPTGGATIGARSTATLIVIDNDRVGPNTITLTGIIRDFKSSVTYQGKPNPGGHPDFENSDSAFEKGRIKSTLGSDKKPIYVVDCKKGKKLTKGKAYFAQWYRAVPGVNVDIEYPITLTLKKGVYMYSSQEHTTDGLGGFFPIDHRGFGNEKRVHNYSFTYELHAYFTYQGSGTLAVTSDDDSWVFIDNKLVIDLGGLHSAQTQKVDLKKLGLQVGKTYDFDLFFAERHTNDSVFQIETNLVLTQSLVNISEVKL